MKLVALRDPQIVEVNGKKGRAWMGKNTDGHICRVTIFESGGETIEIEVEELKLPGAELVAISPSDVGEVPATVYKKASK